MKSLRIVLVMNDTPIPFGNAAARWFYVLLRELVARGHRVSAFAACSKPSDMDEARRLFPKTDFDLRLHPFPVRFGVRAKIETLQRPYSYMFSAALKDELEAELAKGYDVLHLEQLWSGWVALRHTDRAVLNVHNSFRIDYDAAPPTGLMPWLHRQLHLKAERRLTRHFPRFTALSDRLRSAVLAANPRADVSVVPLGIDPALYPYIPNEQRSTRPVVSVIGSMNWNPTRSAAVRLLTRIWPGIKSRFPSAKLQLVGWEARTMLRDYLRLPDVIVEENVPDTRPYFERTSVLLYAPEGGSGMKVKILEALAYGVPVVTTSEGIEGLPAIDGVHAGVCEDDTGLLERTLALLADPTTQNKQRASGRALLERHCSPKATVDAMERVYAAVRRHSAVARAEALCDHISGPV